MICNTCNQDIGDRSPHTLQECLGVVTYLVVKTGGEILQAQKRKIDLEQLQGRIITMINDRENTSVARVPLVEN